MLMNFQNFVQYSISSQPYSETLWNETWCHPYLLDEGLPTTVPRAWQEILVAGWGDLSSQTNKQPSFINKCFFIVLFPNQCTTMYNIRGNHESRT
jgi:hypothetical protein